MSNHTGGAMRDALFASMRFDRNELVRECAAAGLVEPLRETAAQCQRSSGDESGGKAVAGAVVAVLMRLRRVAERSGASSRRSSQ